jgi:hypothetical protein
MAQRQIVVSDSGTNPNQSFSTATVDENGNGVLNQLLLGGLPTLANQAATKQYVDNAVGAGPVWTSFPMTLQSILMVGLTLAMTWEYLIVNQIVYIRMQQSSVGANLNAAGASIISTAGTPFPAPIRPSGLTFAQFPFIIDGQLRSCLLQIQTTGDIEVYALRSSPGPTTDPNYTNPRTPSGFFIGSEKCVLSYSLF